MMHTLSKNLKTWLCFSWVWLVGIAIGLLSMPTVTSSFAQQNVRCFADGSSIPILPQTVYTLTEGGPTHIYSVTLCTEPQNLVSVTVKLDALAQQQVSIKPTDVLLFDATDWQTPQPVTIQAIDDQIGETRSQTVVIRHAASSAGDPDYNYPNVDKSEVKIIVLDNDDYKNYLPNIQQAAPTATPTATPTPVWQKLVASPPHVDVLAVNNNRLFAGERSDDTNVRGIYQSASCAIGATFTKLQGSVRVQDFAFSGQFGIAATNGDRVYYSKNDGATWQRTNSAMNQFVFAVAIIDIGQAYAGADDGGYRSTDNGATWSKVNPVGNGPTLINAFTYARTENILWIATQGGGVWKLTPGSNQFTQVIGGLANPDTDRRVWDILRRNAGEFYIGTTNGVYTGNGAGNWSPFGLQGSQILSLELVGNVLYAGVRDGGVRQTTLGGTPAWTPENGIPANLTVRDLFYDQSGLCNDPTTGRKALLGGTTNGIWIYR